MCRRVEWSGVEGYLAHSEPEIGHGAGVLGLGLCTAADVLHVVCE